MVFLYVQILGEVVTETECLGKMIAPCQRRPRKMRGGVVQINIIHACDKTCLNCTQGSNLIGEANIMSLGQFEEAVLSLKSYWGVVGIFGGNPAMHPHFEEICNILQKYISYEQRGLWCNHPKGKGKIMEKTFNPGISNLNVHMDKSAYEEFKRDWPASRPFGLDTDSRHSPPWVAMCDLDISKEKQWELISNCDINQHWSAMIGIFRGKLRGWFCEIAGAQSILHQDDPDYPDTGLDLSCDPLWWQRLMYPAFVEQVRKHCHECGVPLRGFGSLALDPQGSNQVSKTHESVYHPKAHREMEIVTELSQIGCPLPSVIDYIGNANRKNNEKAKCETGSPGSDCSEPHRHGGR